MRSGIQGINERAGNRAEQGSVLHSQHDEGKLHLVLRPVRDKRGRAKQGFFISQASGAQA